MSDLSSASSVSFLFLWLMMTLIELLGLGDIPLSNDVCACVFVYSSHLSVKYQRRVTNTGSGTIRSKWQFTRRRRQPRRQVLPPMRRRPNRSILRPTAITNLKNIQIGPIDSNPTSPLTRPSIYPSLNITRPKITTLSISTHQVRARHTVHYQRHPTVATQNYHFHSAQRSSWPPSALTNDSPPLARSR